MTNPEEPPMVAVPAPVLAELLRVASLHPLVQAVGAAQRILRQAVEVKTEEQVS